MPNHEAASLILKMRLFLDAESIADSLATFATLNESLMAVPSDALGLFLAAQALPPDASPTELLVQALREHRRVMLVAGNLQTIAELVEGIRPFYSSEKQAPGQASVAQAALPLSVKACLMPSKDDEEASAPALMIVLASERNKFFEDYHGTSECDSDALEMYGPSLEPVRIEGTHVEVCTRCVSNREPKFTQAAESFLS